MLSAETTARAASCSLLPPRSLCTGEGPPWIPFKAIWQRVRGCSWGPSSRQLLELVTP